ncbi:MAG: methyltransferasemethylase [Microbacteriaceae bacterium]|nr:methyltransferasemethylase [Microbacteriaceae bacterium]
MFGRAADVYEKSRPTYPPEAAGWLVPPSARTVVDLGAGTGKFTRSLVELGLDVIAVEPDPKMLSTLTGALPGVRAVEGSAERMPLPDASADVVTVAQAWHWVDPPKALPEIARVLRPGGTLGLVWNLRDIRVDWVRKLGEVMGGSEAEEFTKGDITIGEPFGETEYFEVDWSMPTSADALVDLVASRSYIIEATEEHRQRVFAAVRELVASEPALAGRESFELPYRTRCFRATIG